MASGGTLDVLVVDAAPDRRASAVAVLRATGCRAREAATADEALELCRAEPPEVLVADEEAWRGEHASMLATIKSDPDLFAIEVVVRAPRLDVDEALDGVGRGVHGVLVDPVADAELVATVRSAARAGALRAELRSRAADLERLAFGDSLTGIPNRRFLDRQLAALVSAARRHGRPLAVALVDVDRFKPVNDRHGHAVGDEVLAAVAARLAARLRAEDHVGRFGGEEFLALLPDADAEAAAAIAEALRQVVGDRPIETAAGALEVTVSVGWATWDDECEPPELVARADAALYAAKRAGRDRVCGAAAVAAR